MISSTPNPNYDVIVAGAGPVGLMLATELQLHGANVLLLERRLFYDTSVKAGGLNTASVEAFERRGLLPALLAARSPLFLGAKKGVGKDISGYAGSVGHFGGIHVPSAPVDRDDPLLKGRGDGGWFFMVPQVEVEKVLFARAVELGVGVQRDTEVVDFKEDENGISVQVLEGGELGRTFRGQWLVGCDGGHSVVRHLAGIEFLGTDPNITGRSSAVDIEGADLLGKGWQYTSTGVYVYGPMPGRLRTVEFDGPPVDKDSPVTAEEMEASLRRVSGIDSIRIKSATGGTRFTDNARQASTYQQGRVLLCGDAAHVHSPFSGQGLNLGLGDAINLGWKLAAVVQGCTSEDLLGTYTQERHPIGAHVLDWTRAQVAVMRGDPEGCALRGVMTDLLGTTGGATHYVKQISGLWPRYDLGDDHPLVGRTLPDIQIDGCTRLADHFHQGHGIFMDLTENSQVEALVNGFVANLKVIRGTINQDGIGGLLVRPDGVVAWAATHGNCNVQRLEAALTRWFVTRK